MGGGGGGRRSAKVNFSELYVELLNANDWTVYQIPL